MTSNDISLIETFQAFSGQACTRGGYRFTVDCFTVGNASEGGNKAIGRVYFKKGKNDPEIPLQMEWDFIGNAMKIGSQFDLIVEEPL